MLTTWVQTRKRMLSTNAVELLRTQRTVGVVARAMEDAGMPVPDGASFYATAAYLHYNAVDDEPRRRELCRNARQMLGKKKTVFRAHGESDLQVADTYGEIGGFNVYVIVVMGLRANCHLEYETVTTRRAKVVCD